MLEPMLVVVAVGIYPVNATPHMPESKRNNKVVKASWPTLRCCCFAINIL